jgi:putative endonuclease
MKSEWHVYIVCCQDGTLYTGITTDLARRLLAHNLGKDGARYTRSRRPVNLVFSEPAHSHSDAAQREWEIKQLTVAQKRALIVAQQSDVKKSLL